MNYYIAEGGVQRGPYPVDQLSAQGLRPDSMVWADGMAQWQRADQVPALATVVGAGQPQGHAAQPSPYGQPAYGQPQGAPQYGQPAYGQPAYNQTAFVQPGYAQYPAYNPADSKRLAAGICGILLGGWGVHKFILGFTGAGVIQIVITFATCGIGSIIGLIEGIIYLCKSDQEFYQTYIVERREWF